MPPHLKLAQLPMHASVQHYMTILASSVITLRDLGRTGFNMGLSDLGSTSSAAIVSPAGTLGVTWAGRKACLASVRS